jgi:hypothetical protein
LELEEVLSVDWVEPLPASLVVWVDLLHFLDTAHMVALELKI